MAIKLFLYKTLKTMRYENLLLFYSVATILSVLITALVFSERQSFLFLGSLSNLIITAVSLKINFRHSITPFMLLTAVTVLLITLIICL